MLRVRQLQRNRGHRELHRQGAVGKDRPSPRIPAHDQRQLQTPVRLHSCLEARPLCPQPLRFRLLQEHSQKERRARHFREGKHFTGCGRYPAGGYSRRLCRILFGGAFRKGQARHDGERPQSKEQRRASALRLLCG